MGFIINPYLVQPSGDADAQAFITAAGITDNTQKSAIETLVTDLKTYGIWTKMKAIYPFVGGTSTTHKYNLKDPQDTDAAFRLVFSGGITHASTGITFNGTNGIADTKLNPSVSLGQNSLSYSVYSRTTGSTDRLATIIANTAAQGNSGESSLFIKLSNLTYIRANTSTPDSQTNNSTSGYFVANRNSSSQQNLMIRGTRYDFTNTSQAPYNGVFYIGGFAAFAYDNKEVAFSHFGDGLTNQNLTDLNTAVVAFQTTLGRNV